MSVEKHKCSKLVAASGGFHFFLCKRKPVVEVNGKWYCAIHSPAATEKRRAKIQAKWDAKKAKWNRQDACLQACSSMTNPISEIEALKQLERACRKCDELPVPIVEALCALSASRKEQKQ